MYEKNDKDFSIGLTLIIIFIFLIAFFLIQPWLEILTLLGWEDFVKMLQGI